MLGYEGLHLFSRFAVFLSPSFPWPVELMYHYVGRHLNRDISPVSPFLFIALSLAAHLVGLVSSARARTHATAQAH